MKTKKPMKGLLIYSIHATSGNTSIVLFVALALAVVFLISGNAFFLNMLTLCALIIFPMLVMGALGAGNWERFQLTMPIRRNTLIAVQYLSMVICAIIGVVLVAVTLGVGHALGVGEMFDNGIAEIVISIGPVLGMPFLMVGMVFPLASSKWGKERAVGILTISQFVAIGVTMLAPWAGERLGLSLQMIAILVVAISMLIFYRPLKNLATTTLLSLIRHQFNSGFQFIQRLVCVYPLTYIIG
ncbi:MAG: ABC-2 transporter permease, partial [Oscillospiraceae bacterium]|nr:ABC-2 transporter permease [Oscillospiraceae bacterium]